MIIDIEQSAKDNLVNCDFCIVGTGPAGTSLAMALAKKNKNYNIVMVEGGSTSYSDFSADIYKGDVVGDKFYPLEATRSRMLGGSSNCWGGWCRELDESDFAKWPIKKDDLKPYLVNACNFLGVKVPKDNILIDKDLGLERVFFSFSSPPLNIARDCDEFLNNNSSLRVFTNSNLIDINFNDLSVMSLSFSSKNRNKLKVKSKYFIFAMGGIENSRFLLWFDYKYGSALIKNKNLLGRYWTEHPHFTLGDIVTSTRFDLHSYYGFTPATRQKHKINNCELRLEPLSHGITTQLLEDLLCVAPTLGTKVNNIFRDTNLVCGKRLRATWEMEPRYDNCVTLSSNKRDFFGIPRTLLKYKKSLVDIRTARVAGTLFGEYLKNNDYGRLRIEPWILNNDVEPWDELIGNHHMGGTKMGNGVIDGIVDKNCMLFGKNNFYIAGSSVFPTGGYANPTLTIVQLSLRLADHLNSLPL